MEYDAKLQTKSDAGEQQQPLFKSQVCYTLLS